MCSLVKFTRRLVTRSRSGQEWVKGYVVGAELLGSLPKRSWQQPHILHPTQLADIPFLGFSLASHLLYTRAATLINQLTEPSVSSRHKAHWFIVQGVDAAKNGKGNIKGRFSLLTISSTFGLFNCKVSTETANEFWGLCKCI